MSDSDNPTIERGLVTKERQEVKRPRLFKVLLHNDDYTTMEFVVHVLMKFFRKSETEATQIMLTVHTKGVGVAGLYSRDLAATKAAQVSEYARENQMPLMCTVEPE
jgi:ATP-dependent Clp protease adaptor protein ClpS